MNATLAEQAIAGQRVLFLQDISRLADARIAKLRNDRYVETTLFLSGSDMSRGVMWFTGIVIAILAALVVLFIVIRSHDGPMEIISGGPFQSGELIEDVKDWSFLDGFQTVEMQTMMPQRSRTMWIIVHDNRPYIVSSYMNTFVGKIWKRWPHKVEQDNRVIIRADGRLYNFALTRIQTGPLIEPVMEKFTEKYSRIDPEDVRTGNT